MNGAGAMTTPVPADAARPVTLRQRYLALLTWAFTLFNSVRVLSYVPTMLTIWHSGNSDQHSLLTWLTWLGANATMAAWLYEHNGQHVNRAILVNIGNAAMCGLTTLMITWFRF